MYGTASLPLVWSVIGGLCAVVVFGSALVRGLVCDRWSLLGGFRTVGCGLVCSVIGVLCAVVVFGGSVLVCGLVCSVIGGLYSVVSVRWSVRGGLSPVVCSVFTSGWPVLLSINLCRRSFLTASDRRL